MLCSTLSILGPCFLLVNRHDDQVDVDFENNKFKSDNVTCKSRCAVFERTLPSFNVVTSSIDDILKLNATGEMVFPVDVSFDFGRGEWVDNQNVKTAVQLPWKKNQMDVQPAWISKPTVEVYYPIMNDILVESPTMELTYTTISSTRCTANPDGANCEMSFYCKDQRMKKLSMTQLQAPMTYVEAVAKCADDFRGFILTRTPYMNANQRHHTKSRQPTLLWTGSKRYNASHFKREDDVLFQPTGFAGTYRTFPATVLIRISSEGVLEARNSLADAYNMATSDYCLCYQNASASLSRLFKHEYFVYAVSVLLPFICILVYCIYHFC